MRLLDRYLLRELLVPLALCLAGFFIFWISFDLFSNLEKFQRLRLTFNETVLYYLATAPEQITLVLPISLLLALLYTLTNHARHNELTAMRAAGIGLWRLSAPYLGIGLVFTGLYFVVNEYWAPNGQEKGEEILSRHDPRAGGETNRFWQNQIFFKNQRDGRIWNIQRYQSRTYEMEGIHIYCQEPGDNWRMIDALSGVYTNGAWLFRDATISDNFSHFTRTNVFSPENFSETPELLQIELRVQKLTSIRAAKGAQLSLREIARYLSLHSALDARQNALIKTVWHGRWAAPWTCLVVVLIALPFGAASGRRNVFVGVASSIFICFAYFILQRVCNTLGIGEKLPPWLAAWLPNLAFGAAGVWLVSRIR